MNLRDQVLNWAGRIAKWAPWSSNNGFGRGFAQGPEPDESLGEEEQPQPVRVLQDFGFRSTPLIDGGESVIIACRGGAANAIAVVVDNQQVGPTDLKEGESCQYSSAFKDGSVCRVWLDVDGAVHIDAKAGTNVIVNGGNASVARVGDGINAGTVTAVDGNNLPVQFIYTQVGGTPEVPSPTLLLTGGQITSGAARFKA